MIIVKQNETKFWQRSLCIYHHIWVCLRNSQTIWKWRCPLVPHWFIIMFSLKIAILAPHWIKTKPGTTSRSASMQRWRLAPHEELDSGPKDRCTPGSISGSISGDSFWMCLMTRFIDIYHIYRQFDSGIAMSYDVMGHISSNRWLAEALSKNVELPNRTPQNSNLNKENDGQPTGFESALIIFGQTHISSWTAYTEIQRGGREMQRGSFAAFVFASWAAQFIWTCGDAGCE